MACICISTLVPEQRCVAIHVCLVSRYTSTKWNSQPRLAGKQTCTTSQPQRSTELITEASFDGLKPCGSRHFRITEPDPAPDSLRYSSDATQLQFKTGTVRLFLEDRDNGTRRRTLVTSDSEDSDDLEDSYFLGAIDKDKTACLLPNPQDRKSRRRKERNS